MKNFARYVILAPLAAAMAMPSMAQPAQAQTPIGQSCGGLLCDFGIVGHKVPVGPDGQPIPVTQANAAQIQAATPPDPTRLPCHDFVCGAFGGRDDAAPPPAPVVAAAPEAAPAMPAHKRRRHMAKAATADNAETK